MPGRDRGHPSQGLPSALARAREIARQSLASARLALPAARRPRSPWPLWVLSAPLVLAAVSALGAGRFSGFLGDALGWGLIAFGVWALYDILIADWMTTVLEHFFGYGYAYDIIHGIPTILVGILLVVAGIKLLGLHPAKKADPNEADTLPPYPNEKQ